MKLVLKDTLNVHWGVGRQIKIGGYLCIIRIQGGIDVAKIPWRDTGSNWDVTFIKPVIDPVVFKITANLGGR
jgi:hypothetical protein